ncbi:hypothetical protein QFC21_004349 [Naganishia friedmannii]|uniref:Uncharacterized protein n=1 Tax=Naganishia friedmannii TaxID=89922 RepID=A0ACC2VIR8_9TREE|nr:hypothetical protein QFC21_004349 [Naganishia friedmannii]
MISSTKPKCIPQGSLLYVPASSPKFLKSSLSSPSQTVTYDLEDSVHASAKASARQSLIEWLEQIPADGIQGKGLDGLSIAVRPNSPFIAPEEEELLGDADMGKDQARETLREKSESAREKNVGVQDIMRVWGSKGARRINDGGSPIDDDRGRPYDRLNARKTPQVPSPSPPPADRPCMLTIFPRSLDLAHPKTRLIASIESPEALMNIGTLASWRGRGVELVGLTVCVDYKNLSVLQEEAEEGRRLGFDGKTYISVRLTPTRQQAIHPSQVETIMKAFAPSSDEIYRAALILYKMANSERGAEGVRGKDGKEEMIDKPMVLQAQRIIKEAKAAGLDIPDITT